MVHEDARDALGRFATTMAALTLLAAAAAGCGGGREDAGGGTRAERPKEAASPRTVSTPRADAELADELGERGERLEQSGCSFGRFDEAEAVHVEQGEALDVDHFPPTTGPHYDDWAPFGLYDEPLEDGHVVHNLEHGGVVAWLGTQVEQPVRDAIAGLLDDGEKWVVAPRPDIEGLYSAAWTRALSCPPEALAELEPDELATALDAWYDAVESTGSDAEKDIPAYAGAMKSPSPERDISVESPF